MIARSRAASITAALFLREFAGARRWVHLDIAGPARADRDEHEVTKGATGFGARLLLRWLETLALTPAGTPSLGRPRALVTRAPHCRRLIGSGAESRTQLVRSVAAGTAMGRHIRHDRNDLHQTCPWVSAAGSSGHAKRDVRSAVDHELLRAVRRRSRRDVSRRA